MPAARPSSRVDLPEPFSPTRKVTGLLNPSRSSQRKVGRVQGNSSSLTPGFRSMAVRYTGGPSRPPPFQPRRQAGGVPAPPAHGLQFGVELVDQGGALQPGAIGAGLVEHQAQVLAHPVDREAKIELARHYGLPAVVH